MPHEFQDLAGRTWRLSLTIGAARRLKDETGVDLLAVTAPGSTTLADITATTDRLCAVLWAMIRGQALEAGVPEVDWLDAIDGTVLEAAADALVEALLDFFPRGRRDVIAAAIALETKKQSLVADRIRAEAGTVAPDDAAVVAAADAIQAAILRPTGGTGSTDGQPNSPNPPTT